MSFYSSALIESYPRSNHAEYILRLSGRMCLCNRPQESWNYFTQHFQVVSPTLHPLRDWHRFLEEGHLRALHQDRYILETTDSQYNFRKNRREWTFRSCDLGARDVGRRRKTDIWPAVLPHEFSHETILLRPFWTIVEACSEGQRQICRSPQV